MAETGPAGLKALIEQLSDVSKGRFMDPASKAVGHQAMVHIKDRFNQSRSPYGEPWEPVARGGKPLLDTARLRNAFIDDSGNGRVAINNPTKYGPLQNDGGVVKAKGDGYLTFPMKGPGGTKRGAGGRFAATTKTWVSVKQVTIKARPFIPDERGIPPEWEAKMATVARALFAKRYPKLVP